MPTLLSLAGLPGGALPGRDLTSTLDGRRALRGAPPPLQRRALRRGGQAVRPRRRPEADPQQRRARALARGVAPRAVRPGGGPGRESQPGCPTGPSPWPSWSGGWRPSATRSPVCGPPRAWPFPPRRRSSCGPWATSSSAGDGGRRLHRRAFHARHRRARRAAAGERRPSAGGRPPLPRVAPLPALHGPRPGRVAGAGWARVSPRGRPGRPSRAEAGLPEQGLARRRPARLCRPHGHAPLSSRPGAPRGRRPTRGARPSCAPRPTRSAATGSSSRTPWSRAGPRSCTSWAPGASSPRPSSRRPAHAGRRARLPLGRQRRGYCT